MLNSFKMLLVLVLALIVGCEYNPPNEAAAADNNQNQCPQIGSACVGEVAYCNGGAFCHCGFVAPAGSAQASQQCPSQQPPSTCVLGMGCSGEGSTCTNGSVSYSCHCNRWEQPSLVGTYSCTPAQSQNPNPNPGAGGSNQGVNYPTEGATRDVTIYITSDYVNPDGKGHVWCEGAEVAKNDTRADQQAQWAAGPEGVWHAFGCDALNGQSYRCTVRTSQSNSLRFQCYIATAGTATSGDLVRFTCASPSQLKAGEQFFSAPAYSGLISNLNGGFNCQLN